MTETGKSLPAVLSGERREINEAQAGRVSYYVDGPSSSNVPPGPAAPPVLLIHSINAAASAHEVKPLFDACKATRRTYAIDLPGYGHSERSDRTYDQSLMVAAIHAVIAAIRAENQNHAIDALAVSLSCEFLGKAALDAPDSIRSLALVSATGFARRTPSRGPREGDCGRPAVYRILRLPLLGSGLYRLLTSSPSMRLFQRKTWGSKQIDEEMFRTSSRLSRTPGAHRAPLHFLSGYLFCADILGFFKGLAQPVWLSHGVRGDFTDYSRTVAVADRPNWRITIFQTGALPYFEVPEAFIKAYGDFLDSVSAGKPVNAQSSASSGSSSSSSR